MHDIKWSETEKKLARRVFDAALQRSLGDLMVEFKSKAERVTTPEEMWAMQDYLRAKQLEFETTYDYRYSQLLLVFGSLLRQGRIRESELLGLSEEKLGYIQRIATL